MAKKHIPVLRCVLGVCHGRATYRYLIFGPDRQELKENIGKFYEKISGKKQL
jgi:hypothetical protein